jgi:hypothetical protein
MDKPIDIIASMLSHAVKTADNKQALIVVLAVMAKVIIELPGDNLALLTWMEQSTKYFTKEHSLKEKL